MLFVCYLFLIYFERYIYLYFQVILSHHPVRKQSASQCAEILRLALESDLPLLPALTD